METYPSTNVLDIVRLLGSAIAKFLSGPRRFNFQEVLTNWLKGVTINYKSENVILNFLVKKVLLVSDRDLSAHILKGTPSSTGYLEGTLKKQGMSYLAPNALTISHDQQWQRLRPYNEKVLCTGAQHHYQQAFLHQIQRGFAQPVSSVEDIRQGMGIAMLGIVFGENVAPVELIEDIQVLFSLVGNPIKRLLFGNREQVRRAKLYDYLRQLWKQSELSHQPSLLSMAHQMKPEASEEELLQQIPHWMFTFTGSGTDLLVRSLALISSHPEVLQRVQSEINQHNLAEAATISQLTYLEACVLETGRLYPPVTLTFHLTPTGDSFNNHYIPAGMDILHFFPMMQRHLKFEPSADLFQPERWLDKNYEVDAPYSNLFLRGSRTCPGKDLILFVCKSAIAILLEQQKITISSTLLAHDPLPLYFPEKDIRLQNYQ
ncbi:cytochrome P450 [Tolypothrix sp. PCC 7910]|uniref:cytochrome P450 n=1 Tax=Tolypothrix sp. PCC 7910 TaxID=2099387 RepID=UPI0014276FDB|nr:cytochrome P450 [Tolypothrix sp. PCC 7910]QIR37461.1 cytochrome P450 [Tolypothrix sp. PCC 7910]